MKELTELQRKTLEIVVKRTCEHPITGKDIAVLIELKSRESGREGADMRSIIHALRVKGYPICASGDGYWWPQNKDELDAYIQSFQSRVDEQQVALDGMRNGYDKIGSDKGKEAVESTKTYYYRVDGNVFAIPGNKVGEFLLKNKGVEKL